LARTRSRNLLLNFTLLFVLSIVFEFSSRACAFPSLTARSILIHCATAGSKGVSGCAFRLLGSHMELAWAAKLPGTPCIDSSAKGLCV